MDEFLRFPGGVRRDPAVEAWFSGLTDPLRLIVRPWFERMRACGDDVRERFHDGGAVACVADVPFAYVHIFKAHVNVGFFQGADLIDPAKLLQGAGKRMRHVQVRPGVPTPDEALADLIAAACQDIRARIAG